MSWFLPLTCGFHTPCVLTLCHTPSAWGKAAVTEPTRSVVCTGTILTNGNIFMYLSHGNRWLSRHRDEIEVERCDIDAVGFILEPFRNLNPSLIASGPKNQTGTRGSRAVFIHAKVCKSCSFLVPINDKSHHYAYLVSRLSRGQRPRRSVGGGSLRRLKGVAHHHHPFVNLNS